MKSRGTCSLRYLLSAVLAVHAHAWAQQDPAQIVTPPVRPSRVQPGATQPTEAPKAGANALTIAPGERLLLVLQKDLSTRSSKQGEHIDFRTDQDITVSGKLAVPRDSQVRATITKVRRPGRIKGRAEIQLRFDEIALADGSRIPLRATLQRAGVAQASTASGGDPKLKGESGSGGNVSVIAQGGLQGAMIGIMTGSAQAAAYGAGIGAIIGLTSVILQRGPDLDVPRRTTFEARLESALEIPPAAVDALRSYTPRGAFVPYDRAAPASSEERAGASPEQTVAAPRPVLRRNPPADGGQPADQGRQPQPVPAAAPSAEIPADSSGFKVSVDVPLVVVEAVVRDKSGKFMEDLKREDFRIAENGAEQDVRNFSRDELPLAVALVIDRSGSVARYMPELRQAAARTLSQLKPGDQVSLFSFAASVERMEDLTTDRERIADRIAEIQAGGGTNIVDAVFDAVYYLGMTAPERRKAVILISDNRGTVRPRSSEGQTVRIALETETAVYSIKTPGEPIPITLRLPDLLNWTDAVSKMTKETGGEIIDAQGTGSLDAALETAVSRLRLRYTLGYSPAEPFRDAAFRKIAVRLDERFGRPGADYTVHARSGYYPPSSRMTATRKP